MSSKVGVSQDAKVSIIEQEGVAVITAEVRKKRIVQPSDIPAWASAFSGAIGGAVANLIVFPLDLVTTRLQVQEKLLLETKNQSNEKPSSSSSTVAAQDQPHLYKGVWDATVRIYKEEGLFAFYDGAIQDCYSTMLSAFFYFYAYDILRNARLKQVSKSTRSGRPPSNLGVFEELLIGSMAGIFCKFFTSPLNNIVTRQQTAALVAQANRDEAEFQAEELDEEEEEEEEYDESMDLSKTYSPEKQIRVGGTVPVDLSKQQPKKKKKRATASTKTVTPKPIAEGKKHHKSVSAVQIAKEIYNERGIAGFWSGFQATILLSVNPSLTYYFYQILKVIFIRGNRGMTKAQRQRRRDNPTSFEVFFFSASAKTLATLITYPLILVKTQMQVKAADNKKNGGTGSVSLLGTFKDLVTPKNGKSGGLAHLYQGARGQVLKGFFSQGITMLTKDQISRLIIYIYFVISKFVKQL